MAARVLFPVANRSGVPWLALLAAGLAFPALAADVPPAQSAVTCTNPASGVIWQITIDYGRATVDANPARISDAEIAWQDAKDHWNYTLDRKSGKLTVVVASSTGGYFIYDTCALKSAG
jgi:hypothetical protein